jgi:PPK2 family polyphosphate:nucleotide phosphotransferase
MNIMQIPVNADQYRIDPQNPLDLNSHDPGDRTAFSGSKSEGKALFNSLNRELERLQELLYAEGKNKFLVVLQGLDASGKDGTIRHVFDGANPQGVNVKSYRVPSEEEFSHHFLWRVWPHVPGNGMISIFNRSHYEDILVPVVENYIDNKELEKRISAIRNFEQALVDDNTTVLKFFLNIIVAEQKKRFKSRLENSHKHWKFNPEDLETQKKWNCYLKAYESAISKTSTETAPWYIIPSNRKWYRNLNISCIIVQAMRNLNMKFPELDFDPSSVSFE